PGALAWAGSRSRVSRLALSFRDQTAGGFAIALSGLDRLELPVEHGGDVHHVYLKRLIGLQAPKLRVTPAERQQLVVRAALHDAPAMEQQDLVGVHDGAEPLGDDQGRTALHQILQRATDLDLGAAVYAGGCVVQNQNARIDDQRASDG